MSQGLSNTAIASVLNHIFATGTYTKPTGLKLHLYKGDPHSGGAEVDDVVDDTAYASAAITFGDEGDIEANRVHNDDFISFMPVTYGSGGAPYDVTHWAVKDGSGTLLAAGAFPTAITRLAGEPMGLAPGALFIELTRTA